MGNARPLLGAFVAALAIASSAAAAPATPADRALLAEADLHAAAPAALRARVLVEPLQPGRPGVELEL